MLRHPVDEQLRIGFFRVAHGFEHQVEQRGDDLEACQFYVHHVLAAVYFRVGHFLAGAVGRPWRFADVVNERAFKAALKYFFLMFEEHFHAFVFQATDDARTEVYNLFVGVVHVQHGFPDVPLPFIVEEAQQQALRFFRIQYFQFVCVLNVHDFVADVVGRLHQVDEGMPRIAVGALLAFPSRDAQFVGNPLVVGDFAAEEPELGVVAGQVGRERIFDDGGQGGVGHDEAALPPPDEVVGQ